MLSLSPVLPDALPPRQMEVAVGQRPAALAGDLRGGGRKGGGARGRAGGRARRGWPRNRRSRKRSQLLKNKTILPPRVRRQQQAKAGAGAAGRDTGAAVAVGFSGSGLQRVLWASTTGGCRRHTLAVASPSPVVLSAVRSVLSCPVLPAPCHQADFFAAGALSNNSHQQTTACCRGKDCQHRFIPAALLLPGYALRPLSCCPVVCLLPLPPCTDLLESDVCSGLPLRPSLRPVAVGATPSLWLRLSRSLYAVCSSVCPMRPALRGCHLLPLRPSCMHDAMTQMCRAIFTLERDYWRGGAAWSAGEHWKRFGMMI
jgi:hypothetical protein